ncbi:Thioesterase/thiol ester dehydrase-isomerase [Stipitochalara longipes BDJ]|nr:Thioesterase/thiol ester dehydrase-isomerase [Stipitochalara longipes BDJ]
MANDAYRSTDFSLTIEERIKAYYLAVTADPSHSGFDVHPISLCTLTSISPTTQSTTWAFTVPSSLCNKDGNLHGGAASTIFDNLTSTALFTIGRPGFWDNLGVTRFLAVSYFRSVPQGTEVMLECEVVSAGRRMAQVRGAMRNGEGKVCATCLHEKVQAESPSATL